MAFKDRETRNEWSRKWFAKRRAKFFKSKLCAWCGSNEKLELHHLDPKTKVTSVIWSWSTRHREEELKKCIIICKSCHAKHHAEKRKRWIHGLSNTYKKGCRCDECRHAQYKGMKTKPKWYCPVYTVV